MKYCIYVRPSEEFLGVVDEVRARIKPYTISYSTNEPHITLMAIYSDDKNLPELLNCVKRIARDESPLQMKFGSFLFREERRGVLRLTAEVDLSPELQNLHQKVIGCLSELIDWESTPGPEKRPAYHFSRRHAQMLEKWGAPYYGELYDPHCTFAVVEPTLTFPVLDELVDDKSFNGLQWVADDLIVKQKGEDGIWLPVEEFSLADAGSETKTA